MKRLLIQSALLTVIYMCTFGQACTAQAVQHVDPYEVLNEYDPSALPALKYIDNADEVMVGLAYLCYNFSPPIAKRKVNTQQKMGVYEVSNEFVQLDSLSSRDGEDDADKDISALKKTGFIILSIVTLIGMVVLIVYMLKKFR